eukprot:CAMPEP_0182422840 /NCGR_PEP_ID=MMETSP1167-20130531/8653_1 /TAXON_ID=2988 /ORGANISM="Mallomonas Sp, Strain CCMP3275" /LENGTH=1115 /DNA_ID=CAMNT_0024601255 /DNA_START=643 /DNA_END=3990 /DNA_ORIENTATION=+
MDLSSLALTSFLPIISITSLQRLDFSDNSFSGTIPVSYLNNLPLLESLDLTQNSLTGMIPSSFCELSSLTELKVASGNSLRCYHKCFDEMEGLANDFIGTLPSCSSIMENAYFLTEHTRTAYATCSQPQNTNPFTWTSDDFCTFYNQLDCPQNSVSQYSNVEGCPPECLSTTALVYCQTFSLFSVGCKADKSLSSINTLQLIETVKDFCLAAFDALQETRNVIILSFAFNLTSIDLMMLQESEGDAAKMTYSTALITYSLADSTGLPVSAYELLSISYEAPEDMNMTLGSAAVKMICRTTAEAWGVRMEEAQEAATSLVDEIVLALTLGAGGAESVFSSRLKTHATLKDISNPSSTRVRERRLMTGYSNLGNTFVTDMTGNTLPVFIETNIMVERAPTEVPTGAPSIPGEPTPTPTVSPTSAPTRQARCVDIELVDLYGDGWDTAKLVMMNSAGCTEYLFPTCESNPLHYQYCFYADGNREGDYAVFKMTGYNPKRPWEIFWRATNTYEGTSYIGDYDTAMTFTYHELFSFRTHPTDSASGPLVRSWIELVYAENLVREETHEVCTACEMTNRAELKERREEKREKREKEMLAKVSPPEHIMMEHGPDDLDMSMNMTTNFTMNSTIDTMPDDVQDTIEKEQNQSPGQYQYPYSSQYSFKGYVPAYPSHPSTYSSEASSSSSGSTASSSSSSSSSSYGSFYFPSSASSSSSSASMSGTGSSGNTFDFGYHYNFVPERERKRRGLLEPIQSYDLAYSMKGYNGSWYSPNGLGAKFYISYDDEDLILSGTLCGAGAQFVNNTCDCAFDDGEYRWHVTGALSDYSDEVRWSFCGVIGKAGSELLFRVEEGRCVPLGLKYVTAVCSDTVREKEEMEDGVMREEPAELTEGGVNVALTVHGVVELEGLGQGPMSVEDTEAVRQAITQEFRDAQLGTMLPDEATSVRPLLADIEKHAAAARARSRRLETQEESGSTLESTVMTGVKQIAFQVKMSVPRFSTKGLKKYLDKSMSSGLFVTRVKGVSKLAQNAGLMGVTKASLLDLHVIHETLENREFSLLATGVVIVCGLAGLVFAAMIVRSYRRVRKLEYSLVRVSDFDFSESPKSSNGGKKPSGSDRFTNL